MPYVWRTKGKDGKPHPRWHYEIRSWEGRRVKGTGTTSKAETLKLALREQALQDEIRKGLRPMPKVSDVARRFVDVAKEYCEWGEAQGGHHGYPWGKDHAWKRRTQLSWWRETLKFETLSDLEGILPRVEQILRQMVKAGKAGKTVTSYGETLSAFCKWCVDRGYLDDNPLRRLGKFDISPRDTRRPMTVEEVSRLLKVAPPHRRLLYETALASGLRAGELRSLTVAHLDLARGGLYLEARWTKNRQAGFQPLPADLVARLQKASKGKASTEPLLDVPRFAYRAIYLDLDAAGIPRRLPGLGKIDFHALRVTFATLLMESGASAKECQTLMRHGTLQMTLDRYVKARPERLQAAAETVWRTMKAPPAKPTRSAEPRQKTA
ncbi:MAG: tyrosine-type recombinase/integrase [Sedimentisphaerales bacterium]|nr:tyrosine-type recombinase/integrase [Sedimentisphaerales bacterium]